MAAQGMPAPPRPVILLAPTAVRAWGSQAMKVIQQLEAMSPERFLAIYEALGRDGFGPMDDKVAAALKFRPVAIRKLAMAKRADTARKLLLRGRQAELCYELFGSYLMTKAKDLVTEFLDGTGVPHKDGMIDDVTQSKPDGAKVAAVVQELDRKHDPADMTLYLSMASEQWPDVPEVEAAWRMRA
jgi:hypothetical protein